tara:strand:+ start:6011 stop:6292 length:282 start_codon:yes stop_codon:yes gene_type:complete
MGQVIEVDFGPKRFATKKYSADVYTTDIKCRRFEVDAGNPQRAYQEVMFSVAAADLDNIRAIAVFEGSYSDRVKNQRPALICQFQSLEAAQNQ